MRYGRKQLLKGVLAVLLTMPILSYAQDICIPDTATVRQVRGQVFFGYEGKRRPQQGVTVELLRDKGNRKVLATTTSDTEGRFMFKGIKAGHYLLRTKHSQIIGLDVRLNVLPRTRTGNSLIVFVLGADFSKPCGGGHVEFTIPSP